MPRRTTTWYYVYILLSLRDNLFYTGYTVNLQERIKQHNQGKTFSTKSRRPLKLIYAEACFSEKDAKQREKYFKTGIGKKFLRQRLRNYLSKQ